MGAEGHRHDEGDVGSAIRKTHFIPHTPLHPALPDPTLSTPAAVYHKDDDRRDGGGLSADLVALCLCFCLCLRNLLSELAEGALDVSVSVSGAAWSEEVG